MTETNYTIKNLTKNEVNALISGMGEHPLKMGFSVITKITEQVKEQDEERANAAAEAARQAELDAERGEPTDSPAQ